MIEITELLTDNNGESRFETSPVIMESKTALGFLSGTYGPVENFHFHNTQGGQVWESLHPHSKVYVVVLNELLELEVSSGEKRRFKPGDILLLNDLSGKGHKLKTFENSVGILVIQMK